jgi:hypothetical protein
MFNMDKKNSEYRNELAKDLKEMRSNDVLSEAQTNIYKRKDPTKKYFQPINRRAAKSLLETRKKINTELVEKVEKILKIKVAGEPGRWDGRDGGHPDRPEEHRARLLAHDQDCHGPQCSQRL